MKHFVVLITILLVAFTALADIPPTSGGKSSRVKKPAVVDTSLDISLEADAKEAKLIIPASQLKQLRAELDALDAGDDDTAAGGSFRTIQTIVGGTLMSLAFVFGGLWISRNRRAVLSSRTAGILGVAALFGAGATLLYANVGPPPEARTINGKMFSPAVQRYGWGSGRIKLETGTGDRVRLVVPDPKTDAKPGDE